MTAATCLRPGFGIDAKTVVVLNKLLVSMRFTASTRADLDMITEALHGACGNYWKPPTALNRKVAGDSAWVFVPAKGGILKSSEREEFETRLAAALRYQQIRLTLQRA